MTDENNAAKINIPSGRLVFIIDDEARFRRFCEQKLREHLKTWIKVQNPSEQEYQRSSMDVAMPVFIPVSSEHEFLACMQLLDARGRKQDLIYALIDLKMPTKDTQLASKKAEVGRRIYDRLRQENIPNCVLSGEPKPHVLSVLDKSHANYVEKVKFRQKELAQKNLAFQIWGSLVGTPQLDLEQKTYLKLCSPEEERGQRRCLPLSFESPAMLNIRRVIENKVSGEAAAILLLGESGVEFDQIVWFLYREVRSTQGELEYCPFSFINEDDLNAMIETLSVPSKTSRRFVYIQGTELMEASAVTKLCEALTQSKHICRDGDRVVVSWEDRTGDKGVHKREANERLLDLFCLAGHDDFMLVEIPPLSGRRSEDIEVYAEYFRLQRHEDEMEHTTLFDQQSWALLKKLKYPRNFKDLAIFLDRLFRSSVFDIITTRDIRILWPGLRSTQEEEVLEHILNTDPSVPGTALSLADLCRQLLVTRLDDVSDSQSSGGFPDEEEQFFADLEKMAAALEQSRCLETEKELSEDETPVEDLITKGTNFWPWQRYPICPRLLRVLESHGNITVGLVRKKGLGNRVQD